MANNYKVKDLKSDGRISKWRTYAALTVGNESMAALIKYEVIMLLCANVGGALGLVLRGRLYPRLIKSVGRGVVFGKGIVLRHPAKIEIGDNVVIDDNCVLDAKGESNRGISIGDDVFIGRNTIVYCKNGDIRFDEKVNIGVNSVIYSRNYVHIGADTMVAAFAHIMSGGQYNYRSRRPFSEQSSISTGETVIGRSCWLGSKVVVQDGVKIGEGSVLGSGAVAVKDIPADVIAVGIPAKVSGEIERNEP